MGLSDIINHNFDMYSQELQEQRIRYGNFTLAEKQDYWNNWFCTRWCRHEYGDFPIPFSEFQKQHEDMEKNVHVFIPGIIAALHNLGFEVTIEDIFILDDEAKQYLYEHTPELLASCQNADIQQYLRERKKEITNIIPQKEERKPGGSSIKHMLKKLMKHFGKTSNE